MAQRAIPPPLTLSWRVSTDLTHQARGDRGERLSSPQKMMSPKRKAAADRARVRRHGLARQHNDSDRRQLPSIVSRDSRVNPVRPECFLIDGRGGLHDAPIADLTSIAA